MFIDSLHLIGELEDKDAKFVQCAGSLNDHLAWEVLFRIHWKKITATQNVLSNQHFMIDLRNKNEYSPRRLLIFLTSGRKSTDSFNKWIAVTRNLEKVTSNQSESFHSFKGANNNPTFYPLSRKKFIATDSVGSEAQQFVCEFPKKVSKRYLLSVPSPVLIIRI